MVAEKEIEKLKFDLAFTEEICVTMDRQIFDLLNTIKEKDSEIRQLKIKADRYDFRLKIENEIFASERNAIPTMFDAIRKESE